MSTDPLTIIHGDALGSLRTLESESVQTCVTSPPYWGLRDYGVEGQLGLEKTPNEYVARVVEIFSEVNRVLRRDGTLWLNLGDTYAGGGNGGGGSFAKDGIRCALPGTDKNKAMRYGSRGVTVKSKRIARGSGRWGGGNAPATGDLKPKDLVGIPWMVAFALRADGWYLRSDIIWSKPNPMPESVTDRPTKSHEYIFLLSKSDRYHYNAAAIAEPVLQSSLVRAEAGVKFGGNNLCPDTRLQSGNEWKPKAEGRNSRLNISRDPAHEHEYDGKTRRISPQANSRRLLKNTKQGRDNGMPHDAAFGVTRNKRTVWMVATAPFQDAHFATFPPDLIKPCILAGAEAGDVVLDPFAGSGTTGKVAIELGRKAVLIEPKAEYVEMIKRRCQTTIGLPLGQIGTA